MFCRLSPVFFNVRFLCAQQDYEKLPAFFNPRKLKAAGRNANLLLNVGPMPNGVIQPEHQASLKPVGEWMAKNGETIYGTRIGTVKPEDWGVSTVKG